MEKTNFSEAVIEEINNFINEKKRSEKKLERYTNNVLKEDVLEILDLYCTIIFFPLDGESNHGFHVNDFQNANGEDETFVYINTAQTKEKQIFTAAHELGHIWSVDTHIEGKRLLSISNDAEREDLIDRFAAELLMPKDEFTTIFKEEFEKRKKDRKGVSILEVLEIIAVLMNAFFVPRKSVVQRFLELDFFSDDTIALLEGRKELSEETIDKIISLIIRNMGFDKLDKTNNLKFISGLADMLNNAKNKPDSNMMQIKKLADLFEIRLEDIDADVSQQIESII